MMVQSWHDPAQMIAQNLRGSHPQNIQASTASSAGRAEFCTRGIGFQLRCHAQTSLKSEFLGGLRMQWTTSPMQCRQRVQKYPTGIQMTLLDEMPLLTKAPTIATPSKALAYELVQGALTRWSEVPTRGNHEVPTAVFLHGILGGRRNWASFAKRLAQEFPRWQFLLVDLRCHGDSSSIRKRGPHSVASAARDVLQLVGQLKLTPRILIGHSFGGKVAMSMVDQASKPLARPVRVWVLDATPGRVRAGGDGEDHPAELIASLRQMPPLVSSRRTLTEALSVRGFSAGIAQWMATNLCPVSRPNEGKSPGYTWVFDLEGIAEMYRSYEDTNLWPVVDNVPEGIHIDFLRAERSLHRWAHDDVQRIHTAEMAASAKGGGVQMHVLEDAGHWVHTDNPDGLFRILAPSFGAWPSSHQRTISVM